MSDDMVANGLHDGLHGGSWLTWLTEPFTKYIHQLCHTCVVVVPFMDTHLLLSAPPLVKLLVSVIFLNSM